MLNLIVESLCEHKISFLQHFTIFCILNDAHEVMCKHFREEHLCALQVFLCALVSRPVRARPRAQLTVHIVDDLFSQVLGSRFPFLCRRMYPIGTSEQQQCYELLNFIIQLDWISSFHESVASPENDVRGARYDFSSPPLLVFCLVN